MYAFILHLHLFVISLNGRLIMLNNCLSRLNPQLTFVVIEQPYYCIVIDEIAGCKLL